MQPSFKIDRITSHKPFRNLSQMPYFIMKTSNIPLHTHLEKPNVKPLGKFTDSTPSKKPYKEHPTTTMKPAVLEFSTTAPENMPVWGPKTSVPVTTSGTGEFFSYARLSLFIVTKLSVVLILSW
jgi:hypothetical protein